MEAVAVQQATNEQERAAVLEIGRSAFPALQANLIHESPHMLAGRHEDELVGGTVNEIFEVGGDRIGLVTWIFTDPTARGLRAGEALLEETIAYLEDQGCDAIIAIVRWPNTSSSKLFGSHGFARTSLGTVREHYGIRGAASLSWNAMYWPALGYDLWTRGLEAPTGEERSGKRSLGRFLEAAGVNVGLFLLVALALSLHGLELASLPVLGGVIGAVLGIRYVPAWVAVLGDEREWQFWSWGHVTPFAAVIAAFGTYLPIPGNLAPRADVWTYRETLSRLGPAAAVSGLGLVGLYGLAHSHEALPGISLSPAVATTILATVWFVLLVDIVVPTFPFAAYNSRVLYDWHRPTWAVLASVAIILLGLTGLEVAAALL